MTATPEWMQKNLDWHKTMIPRLGKIERCAEMISYYADQIDRVVDALPSMPSFTTRAESAVHQSYVKLGDVLDKLIKKERKE